MPEVLDWRNAPDRRPLLARAVQALQAGDVVAFPTETVYCVAANPRHPDAVGRLARFAAQPAAWPVPLAVRDAAEVLGRLPAHDWLGRRLARRCFPGPVTLVLDGDQGLTALRASAHTAVHEALGQGAGPLLLAEVVRGDFAAATAERVVELLGDEIGLILDDGPTHFGRLSTVVRVRGTDWHTLREGVASAAAIARMTPLLVAFVCTGNTCRSPLAEALCKKRFADRLGCTAEELPKRGVVVQSAGVAAAAGMTAAEEAVDVARDYGAELATHCSQPLTEDLAAVADYLVVMTNSHRQAVEEVFRPLAPSVRLLNPAGDVADPIGGDQEIYRACARQIWDSLAGLVAELQTQILPLKEEGGRRKDE